MVAKVNERTYTRKNILSGVLFGIGFAAFFDEVVFHQLLRWHHFYDQSTTEVGLISDGLFHAFSWFATIGGLFLLLIYGGETLFCLRFGGEAYSLAQGAFSFTTAPSSING